MGSGDWFKAIVGLKRVKVRSAKKKGKGSKGKYVHGNGSPSLANGEKAGVVDIQIQTIAVMRIQAAFRAFMARKALKRLKGTVKFQTSIEPDSAIKQASATLSHIHFWTKIQAQIRARRLCMVTQERLRQKKLGNQLKLEAKLHQIEVEWCGGAETMEEIVSRIYQREEAAVKRERAMAYAFSHQWRANSGQCFGQAYYDLSKESWGWSWKERWIAVRPWETRVQSQSIIPNKAKDIEASKKGKTKNSVAIKILVSANPNSSNGKVTARTIKFSHPSSQKQALQETNREGLSSACSEDDEAKQSETKE